MVNVVMVQWLGFTCADASMAVDRFLWLFVFLWSFGLIVHSLGFMPDRPTLAFMCSESGAAAELSGS